MSAPSASKIVASTWKIIPQFRSRSIKSTFDYYMNNLHFQVGATTPEDSPDPFFCSVAMGKKAAANIYFFKWEDESQVFHTSATYIAMGTHELDQYYNLLRSEGKVEVVEQIEDKLWGFRQFTVKDLDGNRLTFFRFLEGGNPGDE